MRNNAKPLPIRGRFSYAQKHRDAVKRILSRFERVLPLVIESYYQRDKTPCMPLKIAYVRLWDARTFCTCRDGPASSGKTTPATTPTTTGGRQAAGPGSIGNDGRPASTDGARICGAPAPPLATENRKRGRLRFFLLYGSRVYAHAHAYAYAGGHGCARA